MDVFGGYLFSRLRNMGGSKSEGPVYFLQLNDEKELEIEKHVEPFMEDPDLQPYLEQKVLVDGVLAGELLHYEGVQPDPQRHELEVRLLLEESRLWLNKQPTSPQVVPFQLLLLVRWPFRSIWHGVCETSQIYDFVVEHDGKIIWRWSHDKTFTAQPTPVEIPGGGFQKFAVTWTINPAEIESEGIYRVRGIFLAALQGAASKLQIWFAQ